MKLVNYKILPQYQALGERNWTTQAMVEISLNFKFRRTLEPPEVRGEVN